MPFAGNRARDHVKSISQSHKGEYHEFYIIFGI
jgi:hypothetical protein